jgi:hypothetical protein
MTFIQSSNRGRAILCALMLILTMGTERLACATDAPTVPNSRTWSLV